MVKDKRIKSCLSRFDSGAYSRLRFLRAVTGSADPALCGELGPPSPLSAYGVPTAAGRQQQQQQQQRGRRRGQAGARASSDNFRGVGIGKGSRGNNLGRLLRSEKKKRKKNLFATNNKCIKQEKHRNNTEVSS